MHVKFITVMNFIISLHRSWVFFTPPDRKHLTVLFVCLLLRALRGRGDILPLRMEGLCHHRLLLLHRHHPARRGAGVSPGRKCAVTVPWCTIIQKGKNCSLIGTYADYFQWMQFIKG